MPACGQGVQGEVERAEEQPKGTCHVHKRRAKVLHVCHHNGTRMLSSSGASKLPEAKSALACGQGEVERVEEQPKYRGTCYVHKRRAKALRVCNLDGTRFLSSSGASKLPEAKCARVRPRRPRRPKAAKVRSSGLKSNPSGGTCHMHKRRAKVLPVCTMQPCQTLKQRKQHPGTLATVKGACKFHVSVAECPLSCQ